MNTISRRLPSAAILAMGALFAASALPVAAADETPPTGTMEVWDYDAQTQLIDLHLTYADAESGIDHVEVACDDNPAVSYAMAEHILIPFFDLSKGGCVGYGEHLMTVRAFNGDGLYGFDQGRVTLGYGVHLKVSSNLRTGHPVTFTPNYTAGYTIPADAFCMWELRWGDAGALLENDFNETFGSLLVAGPVAQGFCGPWTFTLPWEPVRQFQVSFRMQSESPDAVNGDSIGMTDAADFLRPAVDSLDRHISSSNLPMVYVLPDRDIATVGEPVTYHLYTLGGATITPDDSWAAYYEVNTTDHAITQKGGSSFTFTPDLSGLWSVFWNRGPGDILLGAGFDPPAKVKDTHRPTTTKPKTALGAGTVGTKVPATVTWTGSDVGWGIDHYQLQRSTDGGAWGGTVTTTGHSRSLNLSVGHSYRFRVRAIDKAGNVGAWVAGPKVHVVAVQESAGALHWHGTWSTSGSGHAWHGQSRHSVAAHASVGYTFKGRSIDWIAARGPSLGSAKVYLDGVLVTTVNLHATSAQYRKAVWHQSWASKGKHTVKVVVVGTAGHPKVDVDGFAVLR